MHAIRKLISFVLLHVSLLLLLLNSVFLSSPRDKRIIPLGFASESRRSRALTKHDDAEFSTGLIIG